MGNMLALSVIAPQCQLSQRESLWESWESKFYSFTVEVTGTPGAPPSGELPPIGG